MNDKFLQKTGILIDKVIKSGHTKKPALLPEFIKQFYQYVSPEYLKESDNEYLYGMAHSLWDFINSRKPNEGIKVRVFNPSIRKNGFESQRTIIEINIPDVPFLIDSITAELDRQRLKIHQVIHPVIEVVRDPKSGHIKTIYNHKSDNKAKSSFESVMHFETTHIEGDDLLEKLKASMENVLEHVSLAVSDWKAMRSKLEEKLKTLSDTGIHKPGKEIDEVKAFLKWLGNNNFTFLGYIEYRTSKEEDGRLHIAKSSALGIFKAKDISAVRTSIPVPTKEIEPGKKRIHPIKITKSSQKSIVHRQIQMDSIGIRIFSTSGKVIAEHIFLGLFTSSVYYQSATLIPIIRRKIIATMANSGFKSDGHNGKALMAILETYPRDELLQISEEELFSTSMAIVELSKRPRVRLFARYDNYGRFVSCIIFIPREGFNTTLRERIQIFLEKEFGGPVTDHNTYLTTDSSLVRLHCIIKTVENNPNRTRPDLAKLEKKLNEIVTSWFDGLLAILVERLGERDGESLSYKYAESFPESYMARYHFGGAVCDILKMEEALASHETTLDLYHLIHDKDENYQLKIYHPGTQITLSEILPLLENLGFHAVDELSFLITPRHSKEGIWLHHFSLKDSSAEKLSHAVDFDKIKPEFEEALFRIQHHLMEDDAYNKLILRAGMKRRDVELLRSLSKYLAQTSFTYSHIFMAKAVSRHPDIAGLLVALFYKRFALGKKPAKADAENILKELEQKLSNVTNVAEDRIIRRFSSTIMAALRTNFFQPAKDGKEKSYVSFKFDSAQVPDLPLPKPFAEIFVYSYTTEGIHLRGGKVARGGLRWSDRKEDFRTEVLGLMKAQMVKNSVIVPVGSKGGFVLKHLHENISREDFMKIGIESYKTFLRGLLDITDNIISGKIIPPKDVVRYDENDPYLVVAADKGTATFSDIANGISEEYGFWLGDAFASGGSAGYDHKKMAITAKGAWISVTRHFNELGIDITKQDFTVAGIGDMSGDVFGNGMILSDHIKLVAAFNHQHIFIDPAPDAKPSFAERERLFNLPRSTWADYNLKLVSKGGGIFDRKAKVLKLSSEIVKLLNLDKDNLTPDELIRAILRSNVDLLWNGGIGTYVKSTKESNEGVGDRTNDALRINGRELRCKVVGEGGNLGFTQTGRIEYALRGGKINTDAIDNSAGVDCSDHEVNIKIAFQQALQSGKLTIAKRNNLLVKMTDEVAALVLRDNFLQTQAITIAEAQGVTVLERQARLMTKLERTGLLDRKIEFLPNDEELTQRFAEKQGLTRPEIAVLLAYSKLNLYNDLLETNLPDDPYFSRDLAIYFPQKMQKDFSKEIEAHPLRREIIATFVTNSMINRVGATFSYSMQEDTGMRACDVARAYTIARDVFVLRPIWREIEALDGIVKVETQVEMFSDIWRLIERTTSWFLRNSTNPLNVSSIFDTYSEGVAEVDKHLHKLMQHVNKKTFDDRYKRYISLAVPEKLAKKIAYLEPLSSAIDIVKIAKNAKLDTLTAGEIYFEIGKRLSLGWLRFSAQNLANDHYWQRLGVKTFISQIYDQQMRITGTAIKFLHKGNDSGVALDNWAKANEKELARFDSLINDLKAQGSLDFSMLVVAIDHLNML